MKKIQSLLHHFRYDAGHNHGGSKVTWFKLTDEEDKGVGFNEDELKLTVDFMVSNPMNFEGPKNTFFSDEEIYITSSMSSMVSGRVMRPNQIILRQKPRTRLQGGKWSRCMDIELLDIHGRPCHSYALPFSIIGVFV